MIVADIIGDAIRGLFDWFICLLETAAIAVGNFILSALVFVISLAVSLLPPMPTLPDIPADVVRGFQYGNYFFPVGFLVVTITTVGTLWLVWLGIKVLLRWAKGVE